MYSFVDLDRTFAGQPPALGALLAVIDTGRGQERVFADQMPELLKQLSEHARIASITASNAIEGVVLRPAVPSRSPRVRLAFAPATRRSLPAIETPSTCSFASRPTSRSASRSCLHLHRLLFHHVGGRGGYLKTEDNFIVSYETGVRQVVFTPPPWPRTEFLLTELFDRYNDAKRERRANPLVLLSALILDFLAIHPVADGNGRLARLLTTYELLAQGYGVARYVSVEQRIYESKNTYYASIYESQRDWHEGQHSIWPWASYLARVLADAYADFENRVASAERVTGGKQDRAREYILRQSPAEFRKRDLERALPGISPATIRLILNELRVDGAITLEGSGPGARWHRV